MCKSRHAFKIAVLVLTTISLAACSGSGSVNTVAGGAATTTANIPFPAKLDSDAFYKTPEPLPKQPPGTILKSRSVTLAPLLGIPLSTYKAWQLQFISRDSHGHPIAAIATVVKPTAPATTSTPLLAYQYAEDSLGSQCAPSHTLTGSTSNANSQLEGASPLPGLLLGWTLVYPDHEGPDSAYAAGRLSGQITLDSIRAAEQFKPLGLSRKTPVGLWGYSGGSIPTAWADTLQSSYAPELNIVAVAAGGVGADLLSIVKNTDSNPITNAAFFSLILSAVEGVNREYPSLISPLLNAKGRAAFKAMANGCLGATTDGNPKPTGRFADYTTVSDPFDAPNVKAVLPKIDLPQPDSRPIADTFIYHSQLDELIPIAGVDALVKNWCSRGSIVHYYRGITGEHLAFEVTMAPLVLTYLTSRFTDPDQPPVLPPGTTSCNAQAAATPP